MKTKQAGPPPFIAPPTPQGLMNPYLDHQLVSFEGSVPRLLPSKNNTETKERNVTSVLPSEIRNRSYWTFKSSEMLCRGQQLPTFRTIWVATSSGSLFLNCLTLKVLPNIFTNRHGVWRNITECSCENFKSPKILLFRQPWIERTRRSEYICQ